MRLLILLLSATLVGCASTPHSESFDDMTVADKISEADKHSPFPKVNFNDKNKQQVQTVSTIDSGYFAVERGFDVSFKGLLQSDVEVNFFERSVDDLVTDLPRILNVPVYVDRSSFYEASGKLRYDTEQNRAQVPGEDDDEFKGATVTLSYKGSKEGFLDRLCFNTGCGWWVEDGKVNIARYMKKTWSIPLLSGQQNIASQLSNTSNSGGQGQGGGGGSEGSQGASITGSGGQSISSQMNLDVFKSIDEAVKNMLSDGGKLSLSESFGLLTVIDEKSVIDTVDEFVKSVVDKMSIQVAFDVRVLTVEKTNTDNRGIRWDLVNSSLGELGIAGQFNSIVSSDASSLAVTILDTDNDWLNSRAFIQSLSEQVNVIRENKYGGTTLNHTPLPIQVTRDTPYLDVTSTPIANSNGTVVQEYNVIKETVGISMSLLPVVRDEDSLLVHFNLTDSNQVGVKSFDLGELGSSEVPIKDSRNFIQRAMLKSGQTLILTGFSQNIDRHTTSSPFHHKGWFPFGSKNKSNQDTDLMIIITPQIIYNY